MDLEDFYWLLGIQVKDEPKSNELSHTAFIDSILSDLGCKPIISNLRDWLVYQTFLIYDDNVIKDIMTYQSMISSIMCLVIGTWTNLTFAINLFLCNVALL
jgi:hypothetical protein